ncbi:hypothetical protein [Komagataeibacter europaeus]|uniref:hypothetical protein n=1 Tax=Komagataeibacter europaeus TaxID=33995 RepID=UPI001F478405|nr:hypothetical protein [Komagataeibacter europaeus]
MVNATRDGTVAGRVTKHCRFGTDAMTPREGECIYAVRGATGHGTHVHVVMHDDTKAVTWPDRGARVAVMDPRDTPAPA